MKRYGMTKETLMKKTLVSRTIAALLVLAALAGCGPIVQETAMEWMARQPVFTDNP